jgi:Protein of unknown function (DUF2750)
LSQAGAQTAAFFRDVVRADRVWTVRDAGGVPAAMVVSGRRAMPFWSSESRVRLVIANVPAYAGFEPVAIDLGEWRDRWVSGCERDGLLLGINWSGARAAGWDLEATDVLARLDAAISERPDTR